MPIKIRADADENCADVTVLPVLRDGELDLDNARILCSTCSRDYLAKHGMGRAAIPPSRGTHHR
jgi:hypothetical protein